MARKYTFTETEKDQVKQAVKDLETVSCGEIVPFFVNSSDDYDEASWYISTILMAFVTVLIGFLSYFWLLPLRLTPFQLSIIIISAGTIGFLIPILIPITKRLIISSDKQALRVQQRASEAFLGETVFATEERVGILIFVSRLEHQVLVLGDEGINQKVKAEDWEHVVEEVIKGIKQKQIGEGLVNAIGLCKELLLKNGFTRKPTDTNELDDSLRIED